MFELIFNNFFYQWTNIHRVEIENILEKILKFFNLFNDTYIYIYTYLFNIILLIKFNLSNIFETVIGFQYPSSQPCWAKPNTLVELFENPKMLIFTNDINSLNFKFDIYTPKPLWETMSIPEDSIFAKPKTKTTIFFSEIQNIDLSDEEFDKLSNAIKFIEIQINIEECNLSFASDSLNNNNFFFKFILDIFYIFLHEINLEEINFNFLKFLSFSNIKFNNLFKYEAILIKSDLTFFLNKCFYINALFSFFVFKNEFFLQKIYFKDNFKYKNLNFFFNIITFNNMYFFFFNIQNKFFQSFGKKFLLNFENLNFEWRIFNISYNNYNVHEYKFLNLNKFNFKIYKKIILINLFKINSDFLIKSFFYKKTPTFIYKNVNKITKFPFKEKKKLILQFEDKLNIYFNISFFNKNINKLNRKLSEYLKTVKLYKKLFFKLPYLIKRNKKPIEILAKKYRRRIAEKFYILPKFKASLLKNFFVTPLIYVPVLKQFFLNYEKINNSFKIKKIKKNKKIKLIINSLNLYKNITFLNNYKIKNFNNFLKKTNNESFKKIIYFFLFIFFTPIFLLINTGILLYIWFNKLISNKLKKKLKKKYYHKYFYHYWFIKTRSYKIKLFFFYFFKKLIIFFYFIFNFFIKKLNYYIFFFKLLFFFLKKIKNYFIFKIITLIYFYNFFFILYKYFFKNYCLNLNNNFFTINKYLKNYFFFNIYKFFYNYLQKIIYLYNLFFENIYQILISSIKFKTIIFIINYIIKINVFLIVFFEMEGTFITYFYKNINCKNFTNKYWNFYLTLCFYFIFLKKKNLYFDYFFLKNNDFFEIIFFKFYISLRLNFYIRGILINIFFKSIIKNNNFLKKYYFKLNKLKILNLLREIKNYKIKKDFEFFFLILIYIKFYILYFYKKKNLRKKYLFNLKKIIKKKLYKKFIKKNY